MADFDPNIPSIARVYDYFLGVAVTWVANQGIRQFIDLGAGMPTSPSTHETAQAVAPDTRVAYVDNDPVVLSHLNALAAHGNTGVAVVEGLSGTRTRFFAPWRTAST